MNFLIDLRRQLSVCTHQTVRCVRSIPSMWNHFWFRHTDPHGLALFRILFGLFLLILWISRFVHIDILFSDQGLSVPLINHSLLTAPTLPIAYAIAAAFMVTLCALTVGWHARIAAVLSFFFAMYFWLIGGYLIDSTADKLMSFMLLVLGFSGAGATLSFDAKRRTGSWFSSRSISILPVRLITLQITVMYIASGLIKLLVADWQDGMMLYHSFQSILATPLAFAFVRMVSAKIVYDILVFVVKLLELLMPVGLWMPRVQWAFFIAGAALHIGIALLLGLWWFLCIPLTYVLFLPPESILGPFRRLE